MMPPLLVDGLSLALIAVTIVLGLAWLLSGQVVRRRHPDPTDTPDNYGVPFEDIEFTARDGLRLSGWLSGEGRQRPVIVFCAGMFGSMDGDTAMVAPFVSAGYDVLQFDWRGHGLSDGQRTTVATDELLDLLGALDYLQAQGHQQVGLMGFSMGGTIALRAAVDRRVACVVADSPFVRINHTIEGYLKERLKLALRPLVWLVLRLVEVRLRRSLRQSSPLHVVGNISPRPVFLIQCADDPMVPQAEQEKLFAACREPRFRWQVDGCGHREAHDLHPEEYLRRVLGFFRQHL